MTKTAAVLALGRSTFDVEFAEQMTAKAFDLLDRTGFDIAGPRELLFSPESAQQHLKTLPARRPDILLLLQMTFTDAAVTAAAAEAFDCPAAIWAVPEPRLGGRLRLNALCGLNLAAHALGLRGREFGYLYADPDRPETLDSLKELLNGGRRPRPAPASAPPAAAEPSAAARRAVKALSKARIARIGRRPDGFDTCGCDEKTLKALTGAEVENLELNTLFDLAENIPEAAAAETRALAESRLKGLDKVDQGQLGRSLRLKNALDILREKGGYDAFALRCWPEAFTEYGGAVCGPVSMMSEQRVPCACEADVHGAVTSLMLQAVAGAPAFQVDLVDLDQDDGTGVIWHCGQAPVSMADPEAPAPEATVHTNRKMPLLYQFALKPGRVTLARFSRARGEIKLAVAGGEILRRPMAFTGTSGVVAYDAGPAAVLDKIMGAGLEHHTCMAYGDHRADLRAAAAELGVPVLDIA